MPIRRAGQGNRAVLLGDRQALAAIITADIAPKAINGHAAHEDHAPDQSHLQRFADRLAMARQIGATQSQKQQS